MLKGLPFSLALVCFLAIITAGCSNAVFTLISGQNASATTSVTVPLTTQISAQTATGSQFYTIEGKGNDRKSFTLYGDRERIFSLSYTGENTFAVTLEDGQMHEIDQLVNNWGPYTGDKSVLLGSGIYYLDVTATGPWTVTISSF
jgi:hypothetical protein